MFIRVLVSNLARKRPSRRSTAATLPTLARPSRGHQELATKLLAEIPARVEVLLLQDPVIDGFDVEAPITTHAKGRNLVPLHNR
jgi:hypothetical protein